MTPQQLSVIGFSFSSDFRHDTQTNKIVNRLIDYRSITWLTNSLSISVKYSSPGGQLAMGAGGCINTTAEKEAMNQ